MLFCWGIFTCKKTANYSYAGAYLDAYPPFRGEVDRRIMSWMRGRKKIHLHQTILELNLTPLKLSGLSTIDLCEIESRGG